jgi:IS1 family transposase
MPNLRLSTDKRALVLAALCEGTPINAVCRISGVAKETVLRIIRETGEALADYMMTKFRDLPCKRVELDEQWQYVGKHGQRMMKKEAERGDFWLWCAVDPDTKLVFSYRVGRRTSDVGQDFLYDVAKRVRGPVQIATDNFAQYPFHVRGAFGYEGYSYGTETKVFGEPQNWPRTEAEDRRKHGIPGRKR